MFLIRTGTVGLCSLQKLSVGQSWCARGRQAYSKTRAPLVQSLVGSSTRPGPRPGACRRVYSSSTATRQPVFSPADLDKNILVYRNDKFGFYRLVGAFALAQLGFWTYLTYSAHTSMTDSKNFELVKYGPEGAPADQKNWTSLSGIRMKLHSGLWRYVVTSLCFVVGCGIFLGAFTYTKRVIHRIVLRKGGERVTFSTFGFFGRPFSFTVPVASVSCQHSRHSIRTQLPIKVRGHRFFYLLDKEGRMYNAPLFDQTVGMRRMLL